MGVCIVKDLSYLQVFDTKTLRNARRILQKGFTAGDINRFLRKAEMMNEMGWELKKPCGGCRKKKEAK